MVQQQHSASTRLRSSRPEPGSLRAARLTDVCRGCQSQATNQTGAQVRDDVSVQVGHHLQIHRSIGRAQAIVKLRAKPALSSPTASQP